MPSRHTGGRSPSIRSTGATFSLALAYKNAGRADEARAGFERAVALDPRNGKALFQLADLAMRRGDFTQAEGSLTRALAHEVDRPPFLVKLGECYIELKRWDDAERALRAALAERGDIERAHYDLALVLEARGDTPGAIAEYEAELARGASHSAAFNLGRLLSRRAGSPRRCAAISRVDRRQPSVRACASLSGESAPRCWRPRGGGGRRPPGSGAEAGRRRRAARPLRARRRLQPAGTKPRRRA